MFVRSSQASVELFGGLPRLRKGEQFRLLLVESRWFQWDALLGSAVMKLASKKWLLKLLWGRQIARGPA